MALMTNLARAEMAVAYVESVMKWPSTNRPEDVKHREVYGEKYGLPLRNMKPMQKEVNEYADPRGLWHGYGDPCNNIEYFLTSADFAIKHGVGLCDDLAAVAFKWLVDVHQVPCNVSYYSMFNKKKPFHAFLLLGEPEAPRMPQYFAETHPPATWPMDAVLCDPWRRDWFEIKDDWPRRVRMTVRDFNQEFELPLCLGLKCDAFSAAPDRSPWRRTRPDSK